jgi:cell division protein FtsI/penicillin-binding protein 2
VGSSRLVATAERYGFNHEPGIAGAAESTLPPATQIQGELDLGSTAIGQGEVQASPLEMATVAATIANGGRRPAPTVTLRARTSFTQVSSPRVAHEVRHMMIDVVRFGTGTSAAIPGVTVAGKTGTAELGLPSSCKKENEAGTESSSGNESKESSGASKESASCQEQGASKDREDTDAWFATFAPALAPRIVVGVLLVKDGAGGETAAPVARQVLEADGLG